ncbi:PLP-dependent aminotransferase family protein [Kitasatospora sp. NPDC004669]|uniref:aminotransferase-like domain-containing protein n=1 Tax=Kitasatospora sp. NPDC004669 TaxID=3154555 RepID=UPI0033A38EB6
MNFLNEIAGRYPDAIPLAAGRPSEEFFEIEAVHRYLHRFERYLTEERGLSAEQAGRVFFQYGRTKGIVHELVARNLAADEGIDADPESVVVTVGCQEAMFLVLRALRSDERDAVLAVAPTYVGLTGAARLVDMPVRTVRSGPTGVDLDDLAEVLRRTRSEGLRPRACYLLPDHSNPSGLSLDLATRHALLDLAEREDLLLLEDNPYGLFTAGGERLPTLKALDTRRRVVYLGSYAKTGLPGARVGFVVADQEVVLPSGATGRFADELAKLKSMLTVNTPPIAQAVIAGKLLENGGSLVRANERETARYRENLRCLLDALAAHFPAGGPVHWNTPGGGFFLVVTLPFDADDDLLTVSARDHGVLWTPMRHFHDAPEAARQLRLSVSVVTPEQIREGVARLADLIGSRLPTAD